MDFPATATASFTNLSFFIVVVIDAAAVVSIVVVVVEVTQDQSGPKLTDKK